MTENVTQIDAAKEKIDEAKKKVQDVAKGVGEKYQRVADEMRREAERASVVAREKYGTAKRSLREGYDRVQRDVTVANEDLNDYVRENPGRAVLIAAGIGFVLGLLFGGGRRR
jgi:ElaB/YqjD/DUF883 family membrane-anchored ribosome-binding protein